MNTPHVDGVGRRGFLKGGALATLGLAAIRLGQQDAHALPAPPAEDAPNQHNMLIVGEQTVFLSHLPMFHSGRPSDPAVDASGTEFISPHRFQVILEATFKAQGKDVSSVYAKDRQAHASTKIYTLEPKELFVLTRTFTPESTPQLRSFPAIVFRGHLEQGGEKIAGLEPTVEITRVVHGRRFDPKGPKPAQLEYLLFGKGSELFLAHAIFGPPDFDQVLSVTIGGRSLDLTRDLRLVLPERKNVVAERIREGQEVSGILRTPGAADTPITVRAITQFYFEEGELLVPATFNPTPEELKK
jgi:hypothetical protein